MLLIGEYETKSSVTAAFNWRRANWTIADEAVDIGGLKLGGDHASVPKLVEPLSRHLVQTDRRQARPTIWLEGCLDLDGSDLVHAGREHH